MTNSTTRDDHSPTNLKTKHNEGVFAFKTSIESWGVVLKIWSANEVALDLKGTESAEPEFVLLYYYVIGGL